MIVTKVKVYKIYYMYQEELGIYPVTSNERLTMKQGERILQAQKIKFDEVLKTQLAYEKLELPVEIYEQYVITNE